MIRITKPVTRVTDWNERGRALIVTLHPKYIEMRFKGLRERYTLGYDAAFWLAVKREFKGRR